MQSEQNAMHILWDMLLISELKNYKDSHFVIIGNTGGCSKVLPVMAMLA